MGDTEEVNKVRPTEFGDEFDREGGRQILIPICTSALSDPGFQS
jgi:hypothetical protein